MFEKGTPKPLTSGRQAGVTNKTTSKAREAISLFVDNNAHRLEGWLDKIAEKDPKQAFDCFQSIIEYHIPKLARTETDFNLRGQAVLIVKPSQN